MDLPVGYKKQLNPSIARRSSSAQTSFLAITISALLILVSSCSSPSPKHALNKTGSSYISSGPTSTTLATLSNNWPTYDRTISRSGIDTSSPQAVDTSPAWTDPIASKVYAQPLIVNGHVIIADEGDNVTSINLSTGQVVWSVNLGTPVNGATLPCGNINPSGITGTPVADPAANKLWVVAFLSGQSSGQSANSSNSLGTGPTTSTTSTSTTLPPTTTSPIGQGLSPSTTGVYTPPPHHELFALSLTNGSILSRQNIDPAGTDPSVEQQRGALTLANGYLYIPYGGLYGDCGDYHGYLLAVAINFKAPTLTFQTPAAYQAGIWDPPGAIVIGGGDILVASGNGASTNTYDGGNTVTELSQLLGTLSTFTPSNSMALNQDDLDLGSTNPVLIPGGYIFIAGKQGVGYILNASNLGGIGGQLYEGEVCAKGAMGGAIYSGGYIYISCNSGLVALKVTKTTFSIQWQSEPGLAGPPIISGGNVWYVDISSGNLYGLNPLTGQVVNDYTLGDVVNFTTPAASNGYLIVVGGGLIQAFNE